jgi:hypothetical protein
VLLAAALAVSACDETSCNDVVAEPFLNVRFVSAPDEVSQVEACVDRYPCAPLVPATTFIPVGYPTGDGWSGVVPLGSAEPVNLEVSYSQGGAVRVARAEVVPTVVSTDCHKQLAVLILIDGDDLVTQVDAR